MLPPMLAIGCLSRCCRTAPPECGQEVRCEPRASAAAARQVRVSCDAAGVLLRKKQHHGSQNVAETLWDAAACLLPGATNRDRPF